MEFPRTSKIFCSIFAVITCSLYGIQYHYGGLDLREVYVPFFKKDAVHTPIRVLLFTYMRSGSTMTGDILQNHTNSFYAFEPLRYFAEDVRKENSIVFFNGTRRSFRKDDFDWLMADMIYRWFTCDIGRINVRDLTSIMLRTIPITLRNYSKCLSSDENKNKSQIQIIHSCKHLFLNSCRNGSVLIVKTIRLKMTSVALLIKWLPKLKVVYLLRDPRGRLISEIRTNRNKFQSLYNFETVAKDMCMRYKSDILLAERLRKDFSGRVNYLLYEKMARDPLVTSKSLYKYLNMNYTNATEAFITKIALSSVGHQRCLHCTKSTDANITSYKWRTQILFTRAQVIDKHCRDVYKIVGYVKVNKKEQLRNKSFPLLVHTDLFEESI